MALYCYSCSCGNCLWSHGSIIRANTQKHATEQLVHNSTIAESSLLKRKRTLLIYSGGTIGMVPSSTGLTPSSENLGTLLRAMPEMMHPDIPSFELLTWEQPLDSSEFSTKEWLLLAKQIEQHYWDFDGFVILHGTDTLSFTASCLSFVLENLSKAVVVTGSMIPLAAPVSDAKRNLLVSMIVSVSLDINEVVVFFSDALLRGNRSRKIDPQSTTAFVSPNCLPLADMGVRVSIRKNLLLPAPRKRFQLATNLYTRILVLSYTPATDDSLIENILSQSTQNSPIALILALYGNGNAPSSRSTLVKAIRNGIQQHHAVIVVASQCMRGGVRLSFYASQFWLLELGVISAYDQTIEAVCTKLSYLLGKGMRGSLLKRAMETSLRGELTRDMSRDYAHAENTLDEDLAEQINDIRTGEQNTISSL